MKCYLSKENTNFTRKNWYEILQLRERLIGQQYFNNISKEKGSETKTIDLKVKCWKHTLKDRELSSRNKKVNRGM